VSTTTAPAPFIAAGWLKMTEDERSDLVRPFYAEYVAVRERLDDAGKYPYNDSFKGQIPSIDPATTGTTPDDEDTAIYLLQNFHCLTLEAAKEAAAIADGYRRLSLSDVPEDGMLRGDVIRRAWYAGGSGWAEYKDVRVLRYGSRKQSLAALPKGRRTNGYDLNGGYVLFRPAQKGGQR
jgi:hypothetical protein